MNAIEIMPYSDAAHRAQVIALWEQCFNYNAAHNRPALSIDKKLGAKDGLLFIATNGGSVIGTVMAGYDGHRGWIYSVAVSPAYRRGGIGRRLVEHAEKALTKLGCVKVNLQIMDGNEAVAEFYAKLGYAMEKRISMGKRIDANCKK